VYERKKDDIYSSKSATNYFKVSYEFCLDLEWFKKTQDNINLK